MDKFNVLYFESISFVRHRHFESHKKMVRLNSFVMFESKVKGRGGGIKHVRIPTQNNLLLPKLCFSCHKQTTVVEEFFQ